MPTTDPGRQVRLPLQRLRDLASLAFDRESPEIPGTVFEERQALAMEILALRTQKEIHQVPGKVEDTWERYKASLERLRESSQAFLEGLERRLLARKKTKPSQVLKVVRVQLPGRTKVVLKPGKTRVKVVRVRVRDRGRAAGGYMKAKHFRELLTSVKQMGAYLKGKKVPGVQVKKVKAPKQPASVKDHCLVKGCKGQALCHIACAKHLVDLPWEVRKELLKRKAGQLGRPSKEWSAAADQARKFLKRRV